MARFNMRYAARGRRAARGVGQRRLRQPVPPGRPRAGRDEALDAGRRGDVPALRRGARHPPAGRQRSSSASRGTSTRTPADNYPLLLHYHPLVIYRHQVLKQADVVLAMVLRSDQFPLDQKRRNFDYYDPITTGDSSLSACVQAMAAAQIGYDELAVELLPRGAVRRPRRHPRQRQRRRARRVRRRGVGHGRVRLRRAVRPRHGAAVLAEPAVGVAGRDVPDAAPRRADARRARRRRVHGHRARRPAGADRDDGRRRPARSCSVAPGSSHRVPDRSTAGAMPVPSPGSSPPVPTASQRRRPCTTATALPVGAGGVNDSARSEQPIVDARRARGPAVHEPAGQDEVGPHERRRSQQRGADRLGPGPRRVGDDPERAGGAGAAVEVGVDDRDRSAGEAVAERRPGGPGAARRRRRGRRPRRARRSARRVRHRGRRRGRRARCRPAARRGGRRQAGAGASPSGRAGSGIGPPAPSAPRTRRTITVHIVMAPSSPSGSGRRRWVSPEPASR